MRAIQVIATTFDGTRAAIEAAVPLARGSGALLIVTVPKIVPYEPADAQADAGDAAVHTYQQLVDELDGDARVELCLCKALDDLVVSLIRPDALLIVGGPSGHWRMSPEERFANRLSRTGHRVLFASSGNGVTTRRSAFPVIALLIAATLCGAGMTYAQNVQYGGFVDVAALDSTANPANHLFRNRGTTPRVDELTVNMAAAYLRKTAAETSRWGIELTAHAGEDAKLFGFSATAPNIRGADALRHLGPTNVSYIVAAGRGLTIQGGMFSSLIGYDSLYAKDNLNYTRPWGADYTPYLMLGVNAVYPATDRLTATAMLVNGYWHLAHANDVPSVGGQLAYRLAQSTAIKQTVLYGPHQPETAVGFWRVLSDTIVERKLRAAIAAAELQVGSELVDDVNRTRAWWISAQLPLRWNVRGPWSVAVRPEIARDTRGRWTGFEQTIAAVTTTLEHKLAIGRAGVILRTEYRYDHSDGPGGGFFKDGVDRAGVPLLTAGQHLLIGAAIVTFDAVATRRPR